MNYHALQEQSDAGDPDSLLIQMQMRVDQARLYGGMDGGHWHFWMQLWYHYMAKRRQTPVSRDIRRGCRGALMMGNSATFSNWVQSGMQSMDSSSTWDDISMSIDMSESISIDMSESSSSFTTSSSSSPWTHSMFATKGILYGLWLDSLCTNPDARKHELTPDEVHRRLTDTPAAITKEMMMKEMPCYDDCLHPYRDFSVEDFLVEDLL